MTNAVITDFYKKTGMETARLEQDVFRLEKERSQEIIRRYLSPGMDIADIGGATGAYSFWLYDLGHRVYLLDASLFHIEEANRLAKETGKALGAILQGDARELPFQDEQFDMVLLFGPLYHLQQHADRVLALSEAGRVLKPGGMLLAATITRYASLLDGFWRGYVDDPVFEMILQQDLENGNHHNPGKNPAYFTESHFHTQEERDAEFSEAGFDDCLTLAVEGFGWLVPDFLKRWEDEQAKHKLLQYIRQTETDPVMIDMSAHVITVCKK